MESQRKEFMKLYPGIGWSTLGEPISFTAHLQSDSVIAALAQPVDVSADLHGKSFASMKTHKHSQRQTFQNVAQPLKDGGLGNAELNKPMFQYPTTNSTPGRVHAIVGAAYTPPRQTATLNKGGWLGSNSTKS
jgi:hypothetical protein